MTTAVDVMTLSLKDIGALGIGQSIGPDDTADALSTLNMMLNQWASERLSVYHLIEQVKQSTGAQSYTVGTGGDWNISRPVSVAAAFARLNNIDYPLTPINSREDYNRIISKSISGTALPLCYFYDPAYPLGVLSFWPVPNASFELHLSVMDVLPQFSAPGTTISLPPQYLAAIRYNLAIWLAPSYQIEPMPSLVRLAASTKRTIKRMNTSIASMQVPIELARPRRFNVYTGMWL